MAIPNMLASDKVRMDDEVMTSIADNMFFYSMVGYYWRVATDFTVKPRFQTRFGKGEKPSIDLTVAGNFANRAELGVTYRTDKAVNS